MRHALPVLLSTAALLVLGFAASGLLAVPSATGSHVALVVEVSGGGAAGGP